jgi:hypothetical protein
VASKAQGVDMVTVVTEGIFSYCSFKVKIDTDRFLGSEQANVRYRGEVVGHVTTAEYGSQMLSLGGVHHLTGGSKKEGRMTAELMQLLGNKKAVECTIDGGSTLVIQAGKAPIVNGVEEQRMRVGCGSAAVGIFARQFAGVADEVVVVDDHITGVLTEHQAGRCLDMAPSGIQMRGRKSTPGRYFQVANPGNGWGGTDIADPLSIIEGWEEGVAKPGLRLLMTSTTGEHAQWYVLDEALKPVEQEMPAEVKRIVERIGENCEPSLCTVLFLGGAGGSLRAGVTENPVLLTRAIKRALVNVTCGGAPAYVWPGGGITVMADVMRMPDNSFGTVPTPAIVAPIEFSMRRDYEALGGHMEHIFSLEQALARGAWQEDGAPLWRANGSSWTTPTRGRSAMPHAGLSHDRPTRRARQEPLAFQPRPDRHRGRGARRPVRRGGRARRGVGALRHVLDELVRELPLLRLPASDNMRPRGVVARRMWTRAPRSRRCSSRPWRRSRAPWRRS